jgi:hypothetical protein
MHENVPVRFGRGRLDSLATKGLAAYLIAGYFDLGAQVEVTEARNEAFFKERFALCGQILIIGTRRVLHV